eukprot:TRINITY_DN31095_c0_g1_i1.p1 TRINITY_DN31095_c0_g1~~TRINITY_DN31095_c0_g1_i1.p1  ORF type:complete len:1077 (+),score=284.97 TRINITY_DN31095_c0_g1_i1:83-3232(+)
MATLVPDISMIAASFEERLQKVTLTMKKTFLELPRDHILCQMACDEASAKHVTELVAETIGTVLRSEGEKEIRSLQERVLKQSSEISTLTSSLNDASNLLKGSEAKITELGSQLAADKQQSALRITDLEGKLMASEQSLIQLSDEHKHSQNDILKSLQKGPIIEETAQKLRVAQQTLASVQDIGRSMMMVRFDQSSSQSLIQSISEIATLGIEAALHSSTEAGPDFVRLQLEQLAFSVSRSAEQLLATHKKLKSSLKDLKRTQQVMKQEHQQQISSLEVQRQVDNGKDDRMRRAEAALKHREKDLKNLETFYNNKISAEGQKHAAEVAQWKERYSDLKQKFDTSERHHQQKEDHSKLESMVTSQLNTFLRSMDNTTTSHPQQQQQPLLHPILKSNTSDHHITKVQHLEELHQLEATLLADSRRYIHDKERQFQERLEKEALKSESQSEKIQQLMLEIEKHISEKQLVEQAVAMVKGELQLEVERNRNLVTLHEQQESQLRDNASRIEESAMTEIVQLKDKLSEMQATNNKALTNTEREDIVAALVSCNLVSQSDSHSSDVRLLVRKVASNFSRNNNQRTKRIIHARGTISDKLSRLRSVVLATSTIVNSQITEFSINFERLASSIVTSIEKEQLTRSTQWMAERSSLERENTTQNEKIAKYSARIRSIVAEISQHTTVPDSITECLATEESDIQFNSSLRKFSQVIRTNITAISDCKTLEQSNNELSDNLTSLHAREAELKSQLTTAEVQLSTLREKVADLEQKQASAEDRCLVADEKNSQLSQSIADEKRVTETVKRDLTFAQSQLNATTEKLHGAELNNKSIQEKCNKLETENAVLESDVAHLKMTSEAYKSDLTACREELKQQQTASEAAARQASESYQEIHMQLNYSKQELETQLREKEEIYRNQLSELTEKAEEQELSRILPLRQRIAVLEQQLKKEQLRVDEIEGATKEVFQNEIETLRDDIARLERELSRSQRDKQQLLQRIATIESDNENHLINVQAAHKANVQRLQSEASLNEKLISENSDKDKEIAKLLLRLSQMKILS